MTLPPPSTVAEGAVALTSATERNALSRFSFDGRPIPQKVREFGKVLDPEILEPGDLLLVCNRSPGWISRQIQKYQAKYYGPEHAQWHHAAVSGGDLEICQATSKGVLAVQYWEYMDGNWEVKVRRLRNTSQALRNRVAYYAATMARTRYGFFNVLGIRFDDGTKWQTPFWRSKGVICSQLYFEACYRIGVVLCRDVRPERVTPAHLSDSDQMEDIDVKWIDVNARRDRANIR